MDDIKLPERAIETIRKLFYERQVVESKITNYLQGLIDSYGLEGDNWSLDTNEMVFRQLEESPNGVVKDAVGTITGDSEGKSYG
jgi:hypothetical protein|tara:strand:+ start:434 stop:685 length:252 start_codon:yes stop_codon:yes gene_type:complete